LNFNHLYIIGGSPCCGKSTIAALLCERHGLQYFKADDFLEEILQRGTDDGDELLRRVKDMTMDELWLRNPQTQATEELMIYDRLFPYYMDALARLRADTPILAEGAAFLPRCVKRLDVEQAKYVCMTPTKAFQIEHYRQREWVWTYLAACSSKDEAFVNWMERDALFARNVSEQAREASFPALVVDGQAGVEEMAAMVARSLGLA